MSMDKSIVKGLQAQMRDKMAQAEASLVQVFIFIGIFD